jgi:hypothetical protein
LARVSSSDSLCEGHVLLCDGDLPLEAAELHVIHPDLAEQRDEDVVSIGDGGLEVCLGGFDAARIPPNTSISHDASNPPATGPARAQADPGAGGTPGAMTFLLPLERV